MITKEAWPGLADAYLADDILADGEMRKQANLATDTEQFLDKHAQNQETDKKIIVVNALGASDYYGPNINGDHFPEKALLGRQTEREAKKNPGDSCGKRLKRYKTFNNGHVFEHHNNDDPENAIGDILTTFWNDMMKRVENIVTIDKDDGGNIIKKYNRGKPLPVSMGCKVPEDYCSICGNAASTRAKYCDHLSNKMGKVKSDGRKIYAINKQPRFFDLSFVTVPADKTAYALKMVNMNKDVEPKDKHSPDPDDEFVIELKKAASAEELKENEMDKEVINEDSTDAENVGFTKAIKKFLNDEIDKSDLLIHLLKEFVGEETAQVIDENDIQVKLSHQELDKLADEMGFEDYIKMADVDKEVSEAIRRVIANDSETSQISPGSPGIPDIQGAAEGADRARIRGGLAVGTANLAADALDILKNGSDEQIKSTLRGRPGLVNFLLRILAGAGIGGTVSAISHLTGESRVEPEMGRVAT